MRSKRLRAQMATLWLRDWWKALLVIGAFGSAAIAGVLILALPNPPQW